MPDSKNRLVKSVFNEMLRLSELGFNCSVSHIHLTAQQASLDLHTDMSSAAFKKHCIERLTDSFISSWHVNLLDLNSNPILRLYSSIKSQFSSEPYLLVVKNSKHRRALSQLRCSSHNLAIETGRWQGLPIDERTCLACNVLDDEEHFVCYCPINFDERVQLNDDLHQLLGDNFYLFSMNYFQNLITSIDPEILTAFARFLYLSFKKRDLYTETEHQLRNIE